MPSSRASPRNPWPKEWSTQELILAKQHARLEVYLDELLMAYKSKSFAWDVAKKSAYEGLCKRLLWNLKLHQRLEERWLIQHDSLCPGHQAEHQESIHAAFINCVKTAEDQEARFYWLADLKKWLVAHQSGPDAYNYSLVESL